MPPKKKAAADDPGRWVRPGERLTGAQRRPAHDQHRGAQHRRPPDPGRLALPLLRGQPAARVRPRRHLRHAAGHPGRHGRALRARRPARPSTLVPFGGKQRVYGFNGLVDGWTGGGPDPGYTPDRVAAAERAADAAASRPARRATSKGRHGMSQISRQQYADLYGPTVGDKIRLGDTDLYVEIEKDLRVLRRRGGLRRRQDAARRHGPGQPAHRGRRRASTWSSPT